MRNRVTPLGDIVAVPRRGAWLGNRGILHEGSDVVRFHASDLWIICALQYKDHQLPQWAPGRFTVLFFHDEAVALAAGHRPCALCRRDSYHAYRVAWAAGLGVDVPTASEINRQLHRERIVRGTHRRRLHPLPWPEVPVGAFAQLDGQSMLVLDDAVVPWSTQGYANRRSRPNTGQVDVITPPSTMAALRAGYEPQTDPDALSPAARDLRSAP
ncbi:MAG: hypothetical protein ACRD29_09975 [Acidimicrobiales bacterium]